MQRDNMAANFVLEDVAKRPSTPHALSSQPGASTGSCDTTCSRSVTGPGQCVHAAILNMNGDYGQEMARTRPNTRWG